MERFAGLNIRGFSPVKFFAEIDYLRGSLATGVYYLPMAKNSRGAVIQGNEMLLYYEYLFGS